MRVAVVGDDGVGKSTLIACLVKDTYVPNIEDRLPPLTLPMSNTSSVTLLDTSPSLLLRDELLMELRSAHCVWLIFSDRYTLERVALFWLPLLRSAGVNLPVVLTQNKHDVDFTMEDSSSADEDIVELMQNFKEIEGFVRCSAKLKRNVNEAFYLCHRAVESPLAPLFDSRKGSLKPLAVQALQRIFVLCDEDVSGVLTPEKLQRLQLQVFGLALDTEEMQQIFQTLQRLETQKQSFVKPAGLTPPGFLALAEEYCLRGRHETVWAILRHFHYTNSLCLDANFLRPHLDVCEHARVELSPNGYQFLVDLFTLYDRNSDGGLSPSELDDLFRPTPGLPPFWITTQFPLSTLRNEKNHVTLQGWLAQWSMFVHLDYVSALAYLAMLGYLSRTNQRDLRSAVRVTKPFRRRNRRSQVYRRSTVQDRQVFHCVVVGRKGCGVSTLLGSFLERSLTNYHSSGSEGSSSESSGNSINNSISNSDSPGISNDNNDNLFNSIISSSSSSSSINNSTTEYTHANPIMVNGITYAVNSVEMPGGKQCYLILQEIDEMNIDLLERCDVVLLAFDSSDPESFGFLTQFRARHQQLLDDTPIVFAALKADLDRAQQRCPQQPDEYCAQLSLTAPLHVSAHWPSSLNALFVRLIDCATRPGQATVRLPDDGDSVMAEVGLVAGLGAVAALSYCFWRYLRAPQ